MSEAPTIEMPKTLVRRDAGTMSEVEREISAAVLTDPGYRLLVAGLVDRYVQENYPTVLDPEDVAVNGPDVFVGDAVR